MADDGSLSIEELRAEVENDQRFKTVYRGFDKKSVNAFIKSLENEMQMAVNKVKAEAREAENKSNEMRVLYLQGQQEVKLAKIQKNKEIEEIKAEFDAKTEAAVEEKTKELRESCEQKVQALKDELEAKNSEIQSITENAEKQKQEEISNKESQMQQLLDEKEEKIRLLQDKLEAQAEEIRSEEMQKLQDALNEKEQQLNDIIDEKNQKISELQSELDEGLGKEIAQRDRQIVELNNKLKNREEAAKKVEESIIAGYKAENDNLKEENNKKNIRIADLEDKLSFATRGINNNINMLESLNTNLSEMLQAKFSECEDIIAVWTQQFDTTSKTMRDSVKVENAE